MLIISPGSEHRKNLPSTLISVRKDPVTVASEMKMRLMIIVCWLRLLRVAIYFLKTFSNLVTESDFKL